MREKNKSLRVVNKVKQLLLKKNLLQPQRKILLTISGGQDSIFILLLLFLIRKQWNIDFSALYCNHLWSNQSLYSYNHVFKVTYCLTIPICYSIPEYFLGSEEESRIWRSKNYYRLQQFLLCSSLMSGHTLTDQVETFFFNTIRGSSILGSSSLKLKRKFFNRKEIDFFISKYELKSFVIIKREKILKIEKRKLNRSRTYDLGLSFLKYEKKKTNVYLFSKKKFAVIPKKSFSIIFIRPLLGITRFDIKNICVNWDLPLFPDQSNQNLNYSRNRLRKQIFPAFRFFLNPKFDSSLYRCIEINNEQDKNMDTILDKIIKQVLTENRTGYFFNLSLFCSFSLPFQRKICFFFFKEKLKTKYNFSTINYFLLYIHTLFYKRKKTFHFKKEKNIFEYIIFPELGIFFISKSFFMFLK